MVVATSAGSGSSPVLPTNPLLDRSGTPVLTGDYQQDSPSPLLQATRYGEIRPETAHTSNRSCLDTRLQRSGESINLWLTVPD